MLYLELFWKFLIIGFFSFGGGFAAVPLIRDVVINSGWMSEDKLSNMIAVSQSTPGPLMINLATYIGSEKGGLIGSILATIAVVIPSFVIMLIFMLLINRALKNKYFSNTIDGLQASVTGLILATAIYLLLNNIFINFSVKNSNSNIWEMIDYRALIVLALLIIIRILYKLFSKKSLSTMILIILSAIIGILIYGI